MLATSSRTFIPARSVSLPTALAPLVTYGKIRRKSPPNQAATPCPRCTAWQPYLNLEVSMETIRKSAACVSHTEITHIEFTMCRHVAPTIISACAFFRARAALSMSPLAGRIRVPLCRYDCTRIRFFVKRRYIVWCFGGKNIARSARVVSC